MLLKYKVKESSVVAYNNLALFTATEGFFTPFYSILDNIDQIKRLRINKSFQLDYCFREKHSTQMEHLGGFFPS